MKAREMLDNLSEGLLRDDRILTVRERELLADLLKRTTRLSASDEFENVLARALAETVTERAYTALGQSLIRRLLHDGELHGQPVGIVRAGAPPSTPPGPSPDLPPGPHPPSPGPPGGNLAETRQKSCGTAVLTQSYVLLDEFLAPAELASLTEYVLARESDFQLSEVVSPSSNYRGVDFDHRRSRVLMELGEHKQILVERLRRCLPQVLDKLGISNFPIARVEAQVTASNHGDFFRCHTDNGAEDVASRDVTFVYFFHREPRSFQGGELRIYESRPQRDRLTATPKYRDIVPEQNQLVVFPSSLAHEITPVECPGGQFADSRFTVNGWLHR